MLRLCAEQAVIAEGYDVGRISAEQPVGRPVQICKPAWVGRWERLGLDDLATEDSQDSDCDNAWADELAKQMNSASGELVIESLPPELRASVRRAHLRAQCKRDKKEREAVERLRLAVPWGRLA